MTLSVSFFWWMFWLFVSGHSKPENNAIAPNPVPKIIPQPENKLLDSLLQAHPEMFGKITANPEKYEVQIIFTQIRRDQQNQPTFRHHFYRVDISRYFNPASMVKLPVALLSLEKLRNLQKPELHLNSRIETKAAGRCQTAVSAFPRNRHSGPSIGQYLSRMLLVSDNNSYNRLYEFLGQEYLNKRLQTWGFPQTRIIQRFAGCDPAGNRCTNPIRFYSDNGKLRYSQPAVCNPKVLKNPLGEIKKGRAHYQLGKLKKGPYDFTFSNYMPLPAAHRMLMGVMFPEEFSAPGVPHLVSNDYRFVRNILARQPEESEFAEYHVQPDYFPAYKKYLFYGRSPEARIQPNLRIFNVVGMSFGYLSDCAYFADFESGTEFFVSAVIYVNENEIINDGHYEYKTIGLPFLRDLGRLLYQYEKHQPKAFKPDLSAFKIQEIE